MKKRTLSGFTVLLCALGWGRLLLQHLSNNSTMHSHLPGCFFRDVTGIPCPSCGITRASLLMLSGDWLTALKTNPLVVPTLLALIVFPIWILLDRIYRRNTFPAAFHKVENAFKQKKVYIPAVLAILAVWLHNILTLR